MAETNRPASPPGRGAARELSRILAAGLAALAIRRGMDPAVARETANVLTPVVFAGVATGLAALGKGLRNVGSVFGQLF